MPRVRQHRVTTVLKARPHEQSTLYAFIPPPYGLEAASHRGRPAWPEPRDVTKTKHVLGSLSLTTCQRPAQPVVGRPVRECAGCGIVGA